MWISWNIDPTPPEFPEIPSYKILGRIGGGSYGEVYLAQTVTGRFRAVKVVKRRDFELERTFEREFEGIKHYEKVSQDHPGLVDVLHVGREPGADFYYYVMELADDQSGQEMDAIDPETYEARTLSSDLRKNRIRNIDECINLGCSLAEALAHLHRCGLTHRDVKPSNIIFVKGEPRLADIGLVAQTGQKTFVGTEGYVPPEGPGTSSADLYSLAMVLYEMHTGKDRLDFPELPTNHQLSPTVNRDEWRALNTSICRAGSPDPRKRFETGLEFSNALRKIRPGVPVDEKGRTEPGRDAVMGKLLVGASIAGLVLAITVIGGVFWKVMVSGEKTSPSSDLIAETTAVVPLLPEIKPPEPVRLPPIANGIKQAVAPVVASPVPKGSIKLDSIPNGATVWFRGEEISRTPIPYSEFDVGKLEFLFKKEGYHEKVETVELSDGESALIRTELLEDLSPRPGEIWKNSLQLQFFPQPDNSFVAPVTSYGYESFLSSTGRPWAVTAQDGVVLVNDPEIRWAFCDWMTMKDRSLGYLNHQEFHAPAPPPAEAPPSWFYCRIENSFSTLIIESEPKGAEIYDGLQLLGQTPARINRRQGPYVLRLSLGGYQEQRLSGYLRDEPISIPTNLQRDRSILFGTPWENSQNMPMVPVGKMMVGKFETRVRDFDQFLMMSTNPGVFATEFTQTPDEPIVKINRDDAVIFCQWLTERERSENLIRSWHEYRLPTDREWSTIAGLSIEKGETPKAREREFSGDFPWGTQWPPPPGSGNFADETGSPVFGKYLIPGYNDGFVKTAPVGSFAPTKQGLYDVGGNVWEWVGDSYDEGTENLGVVRGGGWESYEKGVLMISYRNAVAPHERNEQYGFRYILSDTREGSTD